MSLLSFVPQIRLLWLQASIARLRSGNTLVEDYLAVRRDSAQTQMEWTWWAVQKPAAQLAIAAQSAEPGEWPRRTSNSTRRSRRLLRTQTVAWQVWLLRWHLAA